MDRALRPVDACEVLVLMDNVIDLLSSTPSLARGEIDTLRQQEGSVLAGRCLCCAQWGLSLLVTTQDSAGSATVLFDSGPEGGGLRRNIDRLGVDLARIDEAVISHGHWDHTGGMVEVLSLIRRAKDGRSTPVHLNEGMFVRRGIARPGGGILPFEEVPGADQLRRAGGEPVIHSSARLLAGARFYLGDEIPRVTPYEKGMPGQLAQDSSGQWLADPLVRDERWMAVHLRGRGLLVFTACSHAGVVNVLRHARQTFPQLPLYGVVGGLHLSGAAFEPLIQPTVDDLRALALASSCPGTARAGAPSGRWWMRWARMSWCHRRWGEGTCSPACRRPVTRHPALQPAGRAAALLSICTVAGALKRTRRPWPGAKPAERGSGLLHHIRHGRARQVLQVLRLELEDAVRMSCCGPDLVEPE